MGSLPGGFLNLPSNKSTLSLEDRRASLPLMLENAVDQMMTAGSGWSTLESYVMCNPGGALPRTQPESSLWIKAFTLETFSERLPLWGMLFLGCVFPLTPWARRTSDNVSSLWPTITRSDGMGGPGVSGRQGGLNLRTAVKQETPGEGQLSAEWSTMFAGFPAGWLDIDFQQEKAKRNSTTNPED